MVAANRDADLVVARKTDDGFTYTLPSMLGHMLRQAEALFGPRDPQFTILGVEFNELEYPQTWLPHGRNIIVQLTRSAMLDRNRTYFELAHEVIHMLDPRPFETSVLEEGLATWFALKRVPSMRCNDAKYEAAGQMASDLMVIEPAVVRQLRAEGFRIGGITAEALKRVSPVLPDIYLTNFPACYTTWVPPAVPEKLAS